VSVRSNTPFRLFLIEDGALDPFDRIRWIGSTLQIESAYLLPTVSCLCGLIINRKGRGKVKTFTHFTITQSVFSLFLSFSVQTKNLELLFDLHREA
jgi:hypothetical protein